MHRKETVVLWGTANILNVREIKERSALSKNEANFVSLGSEWPASHLFNKKLSIMKAESNLWRYLETVCLFLLV